MAIYCLVACPGPTITDTSRVPITPVNVNSRYLRFWFVSNGSNPSAGWNIDLSRAIPVDVPVYIDAGDLSKVTLNPGGALVGRTASADPYLGSIVVRRDTVGPPPKSYGGLSFNGNTAVTPVPSQNTYYNITGTKNANNLNGFVLSGDELTYTGITTKSFMVTASVSVWLEEGKEPETLGYAVFVDGVIQAHTRMRSVLFEGSDWPQATALGGIVTMSIGQTVGCRVANLTTDRDVEAFDYTFTVTEI